MDKEKKRKVRILFGCIIGCWVVYSIVRIMFSLSSDKVMVAENAVPEYIQLFSKNVQSKLTTKLTYSNKRRSPISLIDYGSYCVVVYKIDTLSNSLNNKVKVELEESNISNNEIYNVVRADNFKLYYKSEYSQQIQPLIVYLEGDSLKTICSNDSVMLYYLRFSNLSLRYKNDELPDLLADVNELSSFRSKTLPINLMFLRRNKKMYLLILSPTNNSGFDGKLLYQIIYGVDSNYHFS